MPDLVDDDFTKKFQRKLERARNSQQSARDSVDELFEEFLEGVQNMSSKGASNPHYKSYQIFGESKIAIMLFMDIIGYSKIETNEDQRDTIKRLNSIVLGALERAECQLDEIICLPTGDGMCLCFTDPHKPLLVAEEIQKSLLAGEGDEIKLRMGIHSGGVVRVNDLKGWFNLAGDAINMTQRAMDYGDEWHILCTGDACQLLKRIKGVNKLLTRLGPCEVKHGTMLELYNYFCHTKKVGNSSPPQKAAVASRKVKPGARKTAPISGN